MTKEDIYIIQEMIGKEWVVLGNTACLKQAEYHLTELREVAPEFPSGSRYRVQKVTRVWER